MINKVKNYTAAAIAASIFLSGSIASVVSASSNETASTIKEVENSLQSHFSQRDTNFTLIYNGNPADIINKVNDITKDIEGSDAYLAYSMKNWQVRASGSANGGYLTFSAEYWDTKSQEDYVDTKVQEIISSLITPQMTEEQKVKAVHDYIVKHVAYDLTYTKYSPYDALAQGKAVCQGYAMLAYKMLNVAGIKNMIVTGEADGEPHGWNLVYVEGNWYHLDTTWDDPVPDVPGRVIYKYFLLSDSQIKNLHHTWTMATPAANVAYHASTPVASASVQPISTNKTITFTLGSTSYLAGGVQQNMDVAPLLKNDRVYIPVRFIASAFCVPEQNIVWDDKSQTVTINYNGRLIQAAVGAKSLVVNGENVPIPVPVLRSKQETNNRLMLPYRYICSAMGINVTWDAAAKQVITSIPVQK